MTKKAISYLLLLALPVGLLTYAGAQTYPGGGGSSGGSFPPVGCATANGVIFNNATPCDAGFTYSGTQLGTVLLPDGPAGPAIGVPGFAFVGAPGVGFRRIGTLSIVMTASGADSWASAASTIKMRNNLILGWSPLGDVTSSLDTTLTRVAAGVIGMPNIVTDATHTDSTLCQDTTTHGIYFGSGTAGICLGTSGRQFKTEIEPMAAGIDELMKMDFVNYRYLPGYGDNGARRQYGLIAQNVEAVIPELAGHNEHGETINYDMGAVWMMYGHALQQLKADNDSLRAEIEQLKRSSR